MRLQTPSRPENFVLQQMIPAMNKRPLTPAQAYAKAAVEALDAMLVSEPDVNYSLGAVTKLLMKRPKTLRAALSAYLSRSQMQSLNRR